MIGSEVRLPNGFVCDVNTQAVIYPVVVPRLPQTFWDKARRQYNPQPRPHLTLISRKDGGKLDLGGFMELTEIVAKAEAPFIQTTAQVWSVAKPKHVGKMVHQREALVAPCISDDLTELYRSLAHFGLDTILADHPDEDQRRFWHVTLATSGDERLRFKGIGIKTIADWKALDPRPFYDGFQPVTLSGVPLEG